MAAVPGMHALICPAPTYTLPNSQHPPIRAVNDNNGGMGGSDWGMMDNGWDNNGFGAVG